MIKEWFVDLSKLLFPKVCLLCKTDLVSSEEHICTSCLVDLPETRFKYWENNALQQKLEGRFQFRGVNALYYFNTDSKVQDILHEVKYNNNQPLARYLGKLLALKLGDKLRQADLIIPVPLHKRREAERGYNQSALMAEGIGDFLDIEVSTHVVERVRYTETQTNKSRIERVENMQNAFEWKQPVHDKKIVFIDDVITTGSTLESLVLAMPANWNNEISVLSFAAAINS